MSNPDIPSTSSFASFSITPSPSIRKSSANKLDYLYELSYVPDHSKISSESLPLINPYHTFTKSPHSLVNTIKTLIKPSLKAPKEYIQASSFSQCQLPATSQVQFVTLQIPPELPSQWLAQGYTHIHFGAIRLALTYHARKGLPLCARLGLLDTRMKKYQDASIATIETTLNAGTVVVTLFPNFNMSLKDNRLLDALKVEVQIVGVEQDPRSIGATLHYQMAYRLQDHALDLAVPPSTDALMITVDSNQMATCTHIPRQIPTEELVKLLPGAWVTNYEKLWQPHTVAQTTTEPSYKKLEDGTVEITFDHKDTKAPPACFTTQYMMTAAETEKAEVLAFQKDGSPVYAFQTTTDHKYWDVCDCPGCTRNLTKKNPRNPVQAKN